LHGVAERDFWNLRKCAVFAKSADNGKPKHSKTLPYWHKLDDYPDGRNPVVPPHGTSDSTASRVAGGPVARGKGEGKNSIGYTVFAERPRWGDQKDFDKGMANVDCIFRVKHARPCAYIDICMYIACVSPSPEKRGVEMERERPSHQLQPSFTLVLLALHQSRFRRVRPSREKAFLLRTPSKNLLLPSKPAIDTSRVRMRPQIRHTLQYKPGKAKRFSYFQRPFMTG